MIFAYRRYPAKRALSAMRKHGGKGPFGRIPLIYELTHMAISGKGIIWFCINSLWPIEAIWPNRSGSILAQVMAHCLMAPSHYLILCRFQWGPLTVTWGQLEILQPSIIGICLNLRSTYLKKMFKSSRSRWVNPVWMLMATWLGLCVIQLQCVCTHISFLLIKSFTQIISVKWL